MKLPDNVWITYEGGVCMWKIINWIGRLQQSDVRVCKVLLMNDGYPFVFRPGIFSYYIYIYMGLYAYIYVLKSLLYSGRMAFTEFSMKLPSEKKL